jgi:hypothetical protein
LSALIPWGEAANPTSPLLKPYGWSHTCLLNGSPKWADRKASSAGPPLLLTESADEFAALLEALRQEIKPNGIIKNIYLVDLAAIVWEIQRLHRCKAGIVNNTFRAALKSLLEQLLVTPNNLEYFTSQTAVESLADVQAPLLPFGLILPSIDSFIAVSRHSAGTPLYPTLRRIKTVRIQNWK